MAGPHVIPRPSSITRSTTGAGSCSLIDWLSYAHVAVVPTEHGRIGFGARTATPIGLRNDEAMTPRGYRARHDHPWSTASAHDCSSRAPLSTSASLRHRHPEFIRFLKKIDSETPTDLVLHLIVDNDGTHTHAAVKRWLKRHPRIYLQFTPTSRSWLNLVERWFRAFTDKRIRRHSFDSVPSDHSATWTTRRRRTNRSSAMRRARLIREATGPRAWMGFARGGVAGEDGAHAAVTNGGSSTVSWRDRPCQKDPRFPAFEDYELQLTEEGDRWLCYAPGKTGAATAVSLGQGHGPTQEEAERWVRRSFIDTRDGHDAA